MTRRVKLLLAACVIVPSLFAAYALLARFVVHGPVDANSLGVAVAREGGGIFPADCSPSRRPREWDCGLTRDGSDTYADYRVRVRPDSSCWTAARTGGRGRYPQRLEGCVFRWQWSLLP